MITNKCLDKLEKHQKGVNTKGKKTAHQIKRDELADQFENSVQLPNKCFVHILEYFAMNDKKRTIVAFNKAEWNEFEEYFKGQFAPGKRSMSENVCSRNIRRNLNALFSVRNMAPTIYPRTNTELPVIYNLFNCTVYDPSNITRWNDSPPEQNDEYCQHPYLGAIIKHIGDCANILTAGGFMNTCSNHLEAYSNCDKASKHISNGMCLLEEGRVDRTEILLKIEFHWKEFESCVSELLRLCKPYCTKDCRVPGKTCMDEDKFKGACYAFFYINPVQTWYSLKDFAIAGAEGLYPLYELFVAKVEKYRRHEEQAQRNMSNYAATFKGSKTKGQGSSNPPPEIFDDIVDLVFDGVPETPTKTTVALFGNMNIDQKNKIEPEEMENESIHPPEQPFRKLEFQAEPNINFKKPDPPKVPYRSPRKGKDKRKGSPDNGNRN